MSKSVTVYTGDITRAIAREELLPENIVTRIVSATLRELKRELARGRKVQLTGFGTFYLSRRPASRARNFRTQEMMEVPAMTLPRFSAGAALKKVVRGRGGKSKKQKPVRQGFSVLYSSGHAANATAGAIGTDASPALAGG